MRARPKNIFEVIQGLLDEEEARRAANNRRIGMVRALVAMTDEDLLAFVRDVNAAHYKPANRTLKIEFARAS